MIINKIDSCRGLYLGHKRLTHELRGAARYPEKFMSESGFYDTCNFDTLFDLSKDN